MTMSYTSNAKLTRFFKAVDKRDNARRERRDEGEEPEEDEEEESGEAIAGLSESEEEFLMDC